MTAVPGNAATKQVTLEDVSALRHPTELKWSPTAEHLSFLWWTAGRRELWVAQGKLDSSLHRVSGSLDVSAYQWSSDSKALVMCDGDGLWCWRTDNPPEARKLLFGAPGITSPAWHPDGNAVAFNYSGELWIWDVAGDSVRKVNSVGVLANDRWGPPQVAWSPTGEYLAYTYYSRHDKNPGGTRGVAVARSNGNLVWHSRGDAGSFDPQWLTDGELLTVRMDAAESRREYVLVGIKTGAERILFAEEEPKGLGQYFRPVHNAERDSLLLLLREDGWEHLYELSLSDLKISQLTFGECEDSGSRFEPLPGYSSDSRFLIFSSNRGSSMERQIWALELEGGSLEQLTAQAGSNVHATVSPVDDRIAYLHAGPDSSLDIWLTQLGAVDLNPKRITSSLPSAFMGNDLAVVEILRHTAADGLEAESLLITPSSVAPGTKRPTILWIHGGPNEQVRFGWQVDRSLAIVYAFHLYLASKGYQSIWVNYRGGHGYGREFQELNHFAMGVYETEDLMSGINRLRSLGVVDEENLFVWGHSYGGTLTMQMLARYPGQFRAGANLAGVFDMADLIRWRDAVYPATPFQFKGRLGGEPGERGAESGAYRNASPRYEFSAISVPLLNLYGTEDEAVDFQQGLTIASESIRLGQRFEFCPYPGEPHVFNAPASWLDALRRVERFFSTVSSEEKG